MGKISPEAKQRYFDKVKQYKGEVEQILAREQNVKRTIQDDTEGNAAYKRVTLAEDRMNLASRYLLLNRISLALLGVKNEAFLNDARKSCYESVIYFEEVVGNQIDAPFNDYEERLAQIAEWSDQRRYELMRKLGLTIRLVEDSFGENSKWKWSFVDLEGRYSAVAKNIIDLKKTVAGLDPRVDGYEARLGHLKLVKELLRRAADRFREKYELSTSRIDDFKYAIAYLGALRRIHTLLGEGDEAENVKKQMEVWKQKMQTDEKRTNASRRKPSGRRS